MLPHCMVYQVPTLMEFIFLISSTQALLSSQAFFALKPKNSVYVTPFPCCRCTTDVAITSMSWGLSLSCWVTVCTSTTYHGRFPFSFSYPTSFSFLLLGRLPGILSIILCLFLYQTQCHVVFNERHESTKFIASGSVFGVTKQSVSDTKKIMPFRFLHTQRISRIILQHNFHRYPDFNSSLSVQKLSRTIQDLQRSPVRVLQFTPL